MDHQRSQSIDVVEPSATMVEDPHIDPSAPTVEPSASKVEQYLIDAYDKLNKASRIGDIITIRAATSKKMNF